MFMILCVVFSAGIKSTGFEVRPLNRTAAPFWPAVGDLRFFFSVQLYSTVESKFVSKMLGIAE